MKILSLMVPWFVTGLYLVPSEGALVSGESEPVVEQVSVAPPHFSEQRVMRVCTKIADAGLEAYVDRADTIVLGTVLGLSSEVPEVGLPFVEVHLGVLDTYKGEAALEHKLRFVGGGNDRVMVLAAAPRFQVGEEVLVFATAPDRVTGARGILGLSDGVYRVGLNDDGVRLVHGKHARSGDVLDLFEERFAPFL